MNHRRGTGSLGITFSHSAPKPSKGVSAGKEKREEERRRGYAKLQADGARGPGPVWGKPTFDIAKMWSRLHRLPVRRRLHTRRRTSRMDSSIASNASP